LEGLCCDGGSLLCK
jgi:hypothetical protein